MSIHDRMVQEIGGQPLFGTGLNPFSTYRDIPNIVLLGDPGAGKTQLFREFAGLAGTEALVARAFLNIDLESLKDSGTLFIDALDERRAGRGDHNAIDDIVRKLFLIQTHKVRIACRAADWLGDTDLAAFSPFFARNGGHVVLSLQSLSSEERVHALGELGVEFPEAFLHDALQRGLEELLGNPQNLTMLADVVRKRSWPNTRTELFREAVEILLEEHSDPQRIRHGGKYSPSELRETAGELCAVRLISDIQAISLTENDRGADFPSYRSLCSGDKDKALATLGRRVFVSGPIVGTVDYAHRTIAENLGAHWLAQKVRNGLPIGRVRALLGIDGRPASELRGLHAWLAVHLPEHAELLIDADPFGVLSYADARVLATKARRHLLHALGELAKTDPWFREGHWASAAVAGLSGPDMVAEFRTILAVSSTNSSLRMLVVDSLSVGHVVPELANDLLALVSDSNTRYEERLASIEALLRIGQVGTAGLVTVYSKLSTDAAELQLRSAIIQRIYDDQFGEKELVRLLHDSLDSSANLPGGGLWRITDKVPDARASEVLDHVAEYVSKNSAKNETLNASEVLREFDNLIVRAFSHDPLVAEKRMHKWLKFRCVAADNLLSDGNVDKIKELLSSNSHAVALIVDAEIESLDVEEERWAFPHRLREFTLLQLNDIQFIGRLAYAINSERPGQKKNFLYELALKLAFQSGPDGRAFFEELYNYADGEQALEAVRQASCYEIIPSWKIEDAEHRRERAKKKSEMRAKNHAEFNLHRDSIQSGTHLSWMAWIAKVYFAEFSDLDRDTTPRDRLSAVLEEPNAEIAIVGLVSLVLRRELTDANEIIRMNGDAKCFPWWTAVIAGLDEYVEAGGDIHSFQDAYLQSALTIECIHPTFTYEGNVSHKRVPKWKRALLASRSKLVADTYLALARAGFTKKALHVDGLHPMLNEADLQPHRANVALALLKEYPKAPEQALRSLIQVAMSECDRTEFIGLVRTIIPDGVHNAASYVYWHAAGFLVAPDEFALPGIDLENEVAKTLFWALRDLAGFARQRSNESLALSIQQHESILHLAFRLYPLTPYPEGGWMGDTNAWDATEYARKLIVSLSTNPIRDSAAALRRLLALTSATSYMSDVRHAIAQQRVRMIDTEFQQPSWGSTVAALSNGTPAGIADLHALAVEHLKDIARDVAAANVDVFKRFWNEDGYGRVTSPKSEESCRDYFVELFRYKTRSQGIVVEPEGHMAADKRADVIAVLPGIKLVIEIKRHYHAQVWSSIEDQLERFYTRDPGAQGFGIYLVFWFGERPDHPIPKPPAPFCEPRSANEMQSQLQALVRPEMQPKVAVVVLDVTGEIPAAQHAARIEKLPQPQVAAEMYRDGFGNSWAGRGRRPKWLLKELENGRRLEDFVIK